MRIVIAVQQDQFTPALEQRLSCRVIFPGELALALLLRMSGSCVPIHISASSRFSAITASGTTAALVELVATALCLASFNDATHGGRRPDASDVAGWRGVPPPANFCAPEFNVASLRVGSAER